MIKGAAVGWLCELGWFDWWVARFNGIKGSIGGEPVCSLRKLVAMNSLLLVLRFASGLSGVELVI